MFKYLEHQADTVIYAVNKSWPEVFVDGARAVFNLMYEIEVIRLRQISHSERSKKYEVKIIEIKVKADSIEGLFVEWLNELLAQVDLNNLIFYKFYIDKIIKATGNFKLIGEAAGINRQSYQGEIKTEVKAATYGALKCGRKNDKYFCRCIVDL